LGQLAPSPKHLAEALWMPRESMLAMAVRTEAVFISAELGYGSGSLVFDLSKAVCPGMERKRTVNIQIKDVLL
jgi:hypothetical protein